MAKSRSQNQKAPSPNPSPASGGGGFGIGFKTSDAVEILKRTTGIDPDTDPEMLKISEDLRIAQMIYDARTKAGLTQTQLAERVGTTQSVISQLEDADYRGHSLSMLRRIAAALQSHVEVRIVPNSAEPVGSETANKE
ncbi:MAG: helix-turn-helix domain-containing protein [Pirellulales bacterium]